MLPPIRQLRLDGLRGYPQNVTPIRQLRLDGWGHKKRPARLGRAGRD